MSSVFERCLFASPQKAKEWVHDVLIPYIQDHRPVCHRWSCHYVHYALQGTSVIVTTKAVKIMTNSHAVADAIVDHYGSTYMYYRHAIGRNSHWVTVYLRP